MSRGPRAGAASGPAHLRVLQEGGQLPGQGVQLGRVGVLQEVARGHEEVLQEALAHALVQLPHQAQEPSAEDLPVLGVRVLLTSPKEHRLREGEAASGIAPDDRTAEERGPRMATTEAS